MRTNNWGGGAYGQLLYRSFLLRQLSISLVPVASEAAQVGFCLAWSETVESRGILATRLIYCITKNNNIIVIITFQKTGSGINLYAFIHVYSPRARADNPDHWIHNFDVNTPLPLCPFVSKFKLIS